MAEPAVRSLRAAGEDLDQFQIRHDARIVEAMQCLWHNKRGMAVLVDEGRQVVGTVTDGSIRRFVLGEGGTDAGVDEVRSGSPVTARPEAGAAEIMGLMHTHRQRCIPVVGDGRLVDVWYLDGLPDGLAAPTAVIMAGGQGLRLRPLTDKVPKPLLKLGSTSIVERIILSLALAGVCDVYLCVNYMAEVFEQRLGAGDHLGVNLRYVREEQPLGTAGALALLPASVQGPIVVTNGDIVTTMDFNRLFEFHWRQSGAITVGAAPYLSHIPYGVLRTVEHHLLSIEEKPSRLDFCSAGIYVLEPHVLRLLQPPAARDMPDLIARVLDEGLPVHVFPITEKWYDIGGTAEFERVLVQFATGDEE